MAHLIRQATRECHPGSLWQGGADDVTGNAGYGLIILCAEEFQPAANLIAKPGTQVFYAPNDDGEKPFTRAQLTIASAASRAAVKGYREGRKVLVSCMQGRNRSGLVTALTLHRLYGMSGERCRGYIRARVPNALTNPDFNRFLDTLKAKS